MQSSAHTDKLWSDGAALLELPMLQAVEHVQVRSRLVARTWSGNPIMRHDDKSADNAELGHDDGY